MKPHARRPVSSLLLATAILALAPEAAAQGKKAPPAKVDPKIAEAKKLFEDGASAYALGNYEAAIKAWEQSYELSKKPLIFESIANAWERLGDARKARDYLSKWRDAAPTEERELLDARIKNLDARVQREEEAAKKAEAEKAEREAREKADEEAKKSKWFLPGAIVTAGGGALLIAGLSIDAAASGKRPDSALCKAAPNGNTYCQSSAADALKSSNTLAIVGDILWITGAAAAAGGVTLLILQKPKPRDTSPPSAPSPSAWVTPVPGGLMLSGRF